MKTAVLFFSMLAAALCLPGCRQGHDYARYVKELDSLKIVTEQAVDYFRSIDSLSCYEAYTKQKSYRLFIESHVNDTVSKETAESLTAFFSTEKPLGSYLAMRPVWLSDARVVIEQVSLLSNDLRNGSIDAAEAVEYIGSEKKHAEKIIDELKHNTQLIRKHLERYQKHLPVVEEVLKAHNAGILPAFNLQKETQP